MRGKPNNRVTSRKVGYSEPVKCGGEGAVGGGGVDLEGAGDLAGGFSLAEQAPGQLRLLW